MSTDEIYLDWVIKRTHILFLSIVNPKSAMHPSYPYKNRNLPQQSSKGDRSVIGTRDQKRVQKIQIGVFGRRPAHHNTDTTWHWGNRRRSRGHLPVGPADWYWAINKRHHLHRRARHCARMPLLYKIMCSSSASLSPAHSIISFICTNSPSSRSSQKPKYKAYILRIENITIDSTLHRKHRAHTKNTYSLCCVCARRSHLYTTRAATDADIEYFQSY
jgi:hypothetical protein